MSKETGQATDFIVLMSGEPQGGLKKRSHQGPTADYYRYESDGDYYGDDRYRQRLIAAAIRSSIGGSGQGGNDPNGRDLLDERRASLSKAFTTATLMEDVL